MTAYSFSTVWQFKAPLDAVWNLVYRSEEWPAWWRGVERVEVLEEGGAHHVGGVRRFTWKSRLPYRLSFDMRTVRVEPLSLIEGEAFGELTGRGLWTFSSSAGVTGVRYDWSVETTKPWMNLLAPLARPLFKWNHDVVMAWGAEGLAKRLEESQKVER
jgi:uncharacterized protein YndB with AHSA1/START domain